MTMTGPAEVGNVFGTVLTIEQVGTDRYRGHPVWQDGRPMFGGEIAARALLAAGATVQTDRHPHSFHSYFLHRGDSRHQTDFVVDRDRDGRSFSSRRVTAVQDGEVLFTMAASFRVETDGPEFDAGWTVPSVPPSECALIESFPLLEVRALELPPRRQFFPTQFFVRCGEPLVGGPLRHAAALTYMSDFSTGLPRHLGGDILGPSLDHSVWFHGVPKWEGWLWVNFDPAVVSGRRGWYSGAVIGSDGRRMASIAQEMVYRPDRSSNEQGAGES